MPAESSTSTPTPSRPFVVARDHRARLLAAINELEAALAAPSPTAGWTARVLDRVEALREAFAHHIVVTEGPDGMYADILRSAPRLSGGVDRLVAEHQAAVEQIEALARLVGEEARLAGAGEPVDDTWPGRLREEATNLLGRLLRHRQRGADLVFEAYQLDIGGCD